MTNQIQIFNHKEFEQLRTVEIGGEIYFVAADVAQILGIENIRQNLAEFPDDEKGVCTVYTLGGLQKMNCINESGLYRLIFQSRKPEAEKFKRWVFHEVLPSIRKTGEYKMNAEKSDDKMKFAIYDGIGEGDIGKIPRLEVNGKLVLTTAQLAKFYGCKSTHIIDNFNNHKKHFIEGNHFFKLEGDDLKNFKNYIDNINAVDNQTENIYSVLYVGKHTANLFLWTARGTARHAKMLNTYTAWDVFEMIEDNYFNSPKISEKKTSEKISKNKLTAKEKIKFLLQAAKITKDAVRRENLIATAEKIIIG